MPKLITLPAAKSYVKEEEAEPSAELLRCEKLRRDIIEKLGQDGNKVTDAAIFQAAMAAGEPYNKAVLIALAIR